MSERPAAAHLASDTGDAASRGAHEEELPDSPRVVRSEALLAGGSYLAILHNQTIYFLRQTRFGKLILTK